MEEGHGPSEDEVACTPNHALEPMPYSVRSVRRESGMEECGNTSDIQVSDEPLELSIIDHSRM